MVKAMIKTGIVPDFIVVDGTEGGTGAADRFHDVVVAGAAANVAFQVGAYLGLGWLGVFFQQACCRHHHTGRAKSALQSMVVLEGLLDHIQRAVGVCLAFDGGHLSALSLNCEHCTRLHGLAVHMHNTSPALRRVTTYMCASQSQIVTQKRRQQRATLHGLGNGFSVYCHGNCCHHVFLPRNSYVSLAAKTAIGLLIFFCNSREVLLYRHGQSKTVETGRVSNLRRGMTKYGSVRYFKTSPEVVRLPVMMYVRFPL